MSRTLITLAAVTLLSTVAQSQPAAFNPVSEGFDGMAMFVADGLYTPGSPNPDVPGCFLGLCEQSYFWSQIANLPLDEVAEKELQAKAFFLARFGLDVDVLAGNGSVNWLPIYADPRINYRTRFVAGEHVHRLGWEVHDPAWLVVTAQELALGGEFEGTVVPAGTTFSFGEYWIQKSRIAHTDGEPTLVNLDEFIVIKYQSAGPIPPPGIHGLISSACEVTASPWGTGVAQVSGSFDLTATDGSEPARQNLRNVLTFDGGNGLGEFEGVYNR